MATDYDQEAIAQIDKIIDGMDESTKRVSDYLKYRGLSGEVPEDIFYNNNIKIHDPEKKKWVYIGAMVAYVTDVDGEVVGLHKTYLSENTDGKAEIEKPKRFTKAIFKGSLKGASIKLGKISKRMGVAEGIETGLAVQESTGTQIVVMPATLLPHIEFPPGVKEVEIWADNDEKKAGEKAAKILARRLVQKDIKVFLIMPEKTDYDWLDVLNEDGPEVLRAAKENRVELLFETNHLPILRQKASSQPFPTDALGEFLSEVTEAIVDIVQAPEALVAHSLLAAVTLAVQGFGNIKSHTGIRPISCFFLSIGLSGERKSSIDSLCLQPHRQHEAYLNSRYQRRMQHFNNKMIAYDAKKKEIMKNTNPSDLAKALLKAGAPPEKPILPNIIIDDPTIEALLKYIAEQQPSVGLFSDEGGRILGGHGMSQENKLKMIATLSKLWDGSPTQSMRVSSGNQFINGKRLSVHLMVQPKIASEFLSNPLFKDQGILSRFLICEPDTNIGKRPYKKPFPESKACLRKYNNRIKRILKTELNFKEGPNRELEPQLMELSPKAEKLFIKFSDKVESNIGTNGKYTSIPGFASKAGEHALRLAGVLTLFDSELENFTIKTSKMRGAIKITEYYLHEALRQIDSSGGNDDLLLAQNLLEWIQNRNLELIPLTTVYQNGPMKIRNAQKARDILSILEEHKWIEFLGEAEVNGTIFKEVWKYIK